MPVAPVESMTFKSVRDDGTDLQEYSDGQTVAFQEGDEHHFVCEASGSNPAPTLRMTLGDHDLS